MSLKRYIIIVEAARGSLIWLFESNRKRFATFVTSNNKQKQKKPYLYATETLHSSNKRFGLEFFDQLLKIFIDKLFRLKDIRSYNDTNRTRSTFAEESSLTFTVMYQFMSKYLDSISFQGEVDVFEGLLLYCEIVLLWMKLWNFSSNIEDSNSIDRLRPLPLIENWELRDFKSRRRVRIMELGHLLTK
ncbi:12286_t:CDS:2, partial [Cetraspora pellucida]